MPIESCCSVGIFMRKGFISMEIYRVSFIGHREIEHHREIEERLTEIITDLLRTTEFVEFQIGRNGEFDTFAASCIKRIQKDFGNHNSALVLVLPYAVADIEYYEKYYDDIIIPEEAGKAHFKSAITKRNQWLVDNADMLIAYVRRDTGGAATCLRQAEKAKIRIERV